MKKEVTLLTALAISTSTAALGQNSSKTPVPVGKKTPATDSPKIEIIKILESLGIIDIKSTATGTVCY